MSRQSDTDPLPCIRDAFREEFARFRLELPEENLRERKPGSIPWSGSGRLFFVFGNEEGREYLEYYGHHRMGDCHGKIDGDGRHVSLPELSAMYGYDPDIPGDDEKNRAEMEQKYRELLAGLVKKGLFRSGPVPGSLAMNAHLVAGRKDPGE